MADKRIKCLNMRSDAAYFIEVLLAVDTFYGAFLVTTDLFDLIRVTTRNLSILNLRKCADMPGTEFREIISRLCCLRCHR